MRAEAFGTPQWNEEEDKKPIPEEALKQLEKTDPDLVAQYRAKVGAPDTAVSNARDMQDYGTVANSVGKNLTDIGNAFNSPKDVVLHNRFDSMGKSPEVSEGAKSKYDSSIIDNATSRNLSRAKEDRQKADSDFWNDQKLTDLGQSRSDAALKRGDEARSRAAAMRAEDPTSQDSQAAREYLKRLIPDADKIPGFENMSAAQVNKVAPGLMDKYKIDESIAARKEETRQRSLDRRETAAQRSADREAMAGLRREEKETDRTWKEEQKKKEHDEKKKVMLNEVEDRRTNINQNLDILDKMIEDKGTWELTGSHNQDLDRLVDQIATDMAKLADPSSVARPAEVELVKQNLVSSGFGNKNSTARQVLKNFRSEVDRRADNAYTIRGIDKPAPVQAPGSSSSTSKPSWAK